MDESDRREAQRLALLWLQSGDVPLRLDLAFEKGYAAAVEAKRAEIETLQAGYATPIISAQLQVERERAAILEERIRELEKKLHDEKD